MTSGENTISSTLQNEVQEQDGVAQETPPRWNMATRIGFRFLFSYFSLMCLNILSVIIQITIYYTSGKLTPGFVDPLWRGLVPWFGRHIVHVNIIMNGRGDSPFDWMLILFLFTLAAIATVVWSVLDRNRPDYARLHQWLRVEVRLALAGAMIIYGVDKVFPLQFGTMGLDRLASPVGNFTPEGMLWVFMASSTGYTIFGGLGEVLGATLLIVPRLANLGAIVIIGVMSNVFALNVFYDVPVKIYAFHYLIMAIFLIIPSLSRLADVLVWNRAVRPAYLPQLFHSRMLNRAAVAVQVLLGGAFLLISLQAARVTYTKREKAFAVKSPLYGIWTVNDFVAAGDPPSLSGENRWHKIIFDNPATVYVESSKGEGDLLKATVDNKQGTLAFTSRNLNATLHFGRPQADELVLDGDVNSTKVHVALHRADETKFPLTSTGLHWIQQ